MLSIRNKADTYVLIRRDRKYLEGLSWSHGCYLISAEPRDEYSDPLAQDKKKGLIRLVPRVLGG